ncbi:MAG: ATP-binding protein [Caulobacteraceae bacterium]
METAGDDAGLARAMVALEIDVGPTEAALTDPEHLHRALVNLLRNAREAIQGSDNAGKGVIRVFAARSGGQVTLALADNGPGLPERAMANLFQPFTGSGKPGGTVSASPSRASWPRPRRRPGPGPQRPGRRDLRTDPAFSLGLFVCAMGWRRLERLEAQHHPFAPGIGAAGQLAVLDQHPVQAEFSPRGVRG